MPRTTRLLGVVALAISLIFPMSAVRAEAAEEVAQPNLQPRESSPSVVPGPVTPDVAYSTPQGGRVEVYSSVGDIEGGADWRQVNEFAYLISSVPKNQPIHATIYNSFWDHNSARWNAATSQWEIYDETGALLTGPMFSPTQAFRDQLNQYSSEAEWKKYIFTLGNRSTINDALTNGSGLADLLTKAKVMSLCSHGLGACLSTTTEEELMHAKYSLFGQAKDSTGRLWSNVVWITSANLNGSSGGKKSNVSIALFNDKAAYDSLLANVWNAEVTQTFTPGFKAVSTTGIQGTNSNFTFYPSPRATVNGQPLDFEGDFLASQTNARLGGVKSGCSAYVVHSLFSTARAKVLDGLAALQAESCSVRIVLGKNSLADIVDTYFSMSTRLRELIDRVEFANVHDKTLTLSYTLNGKQVGTTFGGSANLNGTSLRYDEVAFKATDLTLTRAVEQQSERLYLLARAGSTLTPVTNVTLSPATASIAVGSSLKLTSTITPSDASVKTVKWSSSDPDVATVDSTGTVKAIKAGTAEVTATTLSGVKRASSIITVVPAGSPTTSPTATPTGNPSGLLITSKPVLTMPVNPDYYKLNRPTTAVVTWGQGETEISGTVDLQYYSSTGTWVRYKTIELVNGRGVASFVLQSSKTWRVKAVSVTAPSGATLDSSARYSQGYVYTVLRTADATSTPRLYTTNLGKLGGQVPFLLQWRNPYDGLYPNNVLLEYYTGSKWALHTRFTIPAGGTLSLVAITPTSTRKWRLKVSALSIPKGVTQLTSSSVTLKMVS